MKNVTKLVINGVEYTVTDSAAVAFLKEQALTEEQKALARQNIGATKASLFYAGFVAAITDLNDGSTENAVAEKGAAVEVFTAANGEKVVRLLADVSESVQIDITTDMTLVLNGHTLNLTTAAAYLNFTAGTNCTINGEVAGSAIKKEGITSTDGCYAINAGGNSMKVVGGNYSISGSFRSHGFMFRVIATSKLFSLDGVTIAVSNTDASSTQPAKCIQTQSAVTTIKNSTFEVTAATKALPIFMVSPSGSIAIENSIITATGGSQSQAANITCADCVVTNSELRAVASDEDGNDTSYCTATAFQLTGSATIRKSTVFADAQGAHGTEDSAVGINTTNNSTLVCIDSNVTSTHAAVQSAGNLYVIGGTFSGYSHGGFYLIHAPENKAYINNAVIRFGKYEGSFEDFSGSALAGFYFGDSDLSLQGISAYMDGCTIEGEGGEPFVVRSGAAGYTNTLYISNTVNNTIASLPIRLNQGQATNRAELKIGMGCNFTPDNTSDPQWAEETGKLYRRMKEDIPMDGRDFNALIAYAEAQNN